MTKGCVSIQSSRLCCPTEGVVLTSKYESHFEDGVDGLISRNSQDAQDEETSQCREIPSLHHADGATRVDVMQEEK
jgi:hypothetical protein